MSGSPAAWLLRRYAGGHARAHPWRALIQVGAIATGVALGYAVNLINASALDEFTAAEDSLTGTADCAIVAGNGGFDEDWYARVAADPAVALAAPQLEIDAAIDDPAARGTGALRGAHLRILGIDALRSAVLAPDLVGVPARSDAGPLASLLSDAVFLSPDALAALHRAVGERLAVIAGERRIELPIGGTLPGARGVVATMDLGYAQWRFERLGRLSRIDVKFAPGADGAAAERDWRLPPGMHVERRQTAVDREQGLSRSYRVNLDVLALVALFTGSFLVFSLQSQAIVARRAQLALLRMLGMTRAELSRLLVAEALAFGTLGALLGLAGGAALAAVALRTLGGDLGGGYFTATRPRLALDPAGAAAFFALGLVAALAGAWLPAREAGAQPPAPALKAGVDPAPGSQRPRAWTALAGFALGLALLAAPPLRGIPVGAYAAIGVLLMATIALKPLVAPPLFGALARAVAGRPSLARAAPAWLATLRLARLPRFAAVGAAGIVASFALMVAMATMVDSFRGSFDAWLSQVLAADLYVRAAPAGTSARFGAGDLRRMQSDPDVARALFSRLRVLQLDPLRPPVTLIARHIDTAHPQRQLPLVGPAAAVQAPSVPVWVSEAMVDLYGARPGLPLALPLDAADPGVPVPALIVAGVWRDYARQGGSIAIDVDDYERLTGDRSRTDAALWLRPGALAATVAQRLLGALQAPAAQIVQQADIRALSLRIFDRSFQVTYLLEWVAIAIGLVGLATTFSAQAIARTREFGMLRHLGVTRRQVLVVLGAEASLVTLLAAALGLGAGLGIAWILVDVVNPQSFHWTMDLRVPVGSLAALSLALLVAAALASTLAGRQALSIDALRAVKDDW